MENNLYFSQLRAHLVGLSEDEREDVITFYQEYAADADLAGEALIKEFGTPKQLARRVLVDYSIRYDDVAQQDAPAPGMSIGKQARVRVKRELNLLWVVIIGLLTSWVWIPAILAIFIGLFLVVVLMVIIGIILLVLLATGLFQIVGGIAVMGQNWATGLYQAGIGLIFVGSQLVAWPIGVALIRGTMNALVTFVKWVGRRFASSRRRPKEGDQPNA
jgi:uncharacterized membrane protein